MAGKGRRTASRQAELNRKRKRGPKRPSGIPANSQRVAEGQEAVVVSVGVEDAESVPQNVQQANGVQAQDVPAAPRASRPSPVARTPSGELVGPGQGRLRGERPAAYLYVGAELRRITLLTGAILVALLVLGILL
jgi:hypothetical protein